MEEFRKEYERRLLEAARQITKEVRVEIRNRNIALRNTEGFQRLSTLEFSHIAQNYQFAIEDEGHQMSLAITKMTGNS